MGSIPRAASTVPKLDADHTHDSLPDIPGGWAVRMVAVNGRAIRLTVPADPDAFFDDPAVLADHQRDGCMPYWPYLWPSSLEMAKAVAKVNWATGASALEIGCGIGLVGLAALTAGMKVTFSDYRQQAVDVALYNAAQNGFTGAEGLRLDWRHPVLRRFPVVFGCDVVYERRNHLPILQLMEAILEPGGICWIGDAGRQLAADFVESARERGFHVELRDEAGQALSAPRVGRFQLIVISD